MKVTREINITKPEARSLVKAAGLRLPKAGHLTRVNRTLVDHHFGLADFIIYRHQGQWRQAFVID